METIAQATEVAENQKFWNKIESYPDRAQEAFWEAGGALSEYLGTETQPLLLKLDTSKPPEGSAWWEKALFYFQQSNRNQVAVHVFTAHKLMEGQTWLWGALQGDFNKTPTTGQVIVGGAISCIPIVDQVCDVRDVIANIINLSDENVRKDIENWMPLALTAIGFIPLAGSVVKTVGKVVLKEAHSLKPLLARMEYFESHYAKLKVTVPWGRAPIDWLQNTDWRKIANDAYNGVKKPIQEAIKKAQKAIEYAYGALKTKLQELVHLLRTVLSELESALKECCKRISDKINGWLKAEKKTVNEFQGSTGTINTRVQPEVKPEPHGNGKLPPPKRMKEVKPKCFNAGKKTKDKTAEYDRQLKGQEDGLNNMTVQEYMDGRKRYANMKRKGSGTIQQKERANYRKDLIELYEEDLAREGYYGEEALELAKAKASAQMETLDVLHNPDMQLAGSPTENLTIGDSGVNRSIGAQWKPKAAEIDAEVAKVPESERANTKMNVKIERCNK